MEVTQIKGTSETHPELSPNDEFAAFEIMEHSVAGKRGELNGSYVRQALARGLDIAARTGVNPYRFGFVGWQRFPFRHLGHRGRQLHRRAGRQ